MPDFYDSNDESDDESSPSSAESDEKDTKSKSDEDEDENTALLPKSFFRKKELEVGDVEKVKILHKYEDEILVKCIYGKDEKKAKEKDYSDNDSEEMSNSLKSMDEAMA